MINILFILIFIVEFIFRFVIIFICDCIKWFVNIFKGKGEHLSSGGYPSEINRYLYF